MSSAIATLPASNCTRLMRLGATAVAALSPSAAYVVDISPAEQGGEVVSCALPAGATAYGLWLPPASAVSKNSLCMLYAMPAANGAYSLHVRSGSSAAVLLDVPDMPAGSVEQLEVFFQTVLLVRTTQSVALYHLDAALLLVGAAAAAAAPVLVKLGGCALPSSRGLEAAWVVAKGEDGGSNIAKELFIATLAGHRVHAAVLSISGSVAVVSHRTPAEGIIAIEDSDASAMVASCCVRWEHQEALVLCKGRENVLRRLPLRAMNNWSVVQSSVQTAATRPVLATTSALCSTPAGELWAVDSTSGPCIAAKDIASPSFTEEVLAGSSTSATVAHTVVGHSLYVLSGKNLYAVGGNAGSAKAAAQNTLSAWIVQQQSSAAKKGQNEEEDDASCKQVMESLLQEKQKKAKNTAVVRDCFYVKENRHVLLEKLEGFAKARRVPYSTVLLRYVSAMESVQPLTVLLALNQQQDEALILAVASLLAEKSSLRSGGLGRMDALRRSTDVFLTTSMPSPLQQKQYTAALCRVAVAALAAGALGAVRILFTVADACVTVTYGKHQSTQVATVPSAEERALEESIADAVSVMSSFSEWALTSASSAIGMASAHMGGPSGLKKEACLRDGQAHAIQTSRSIEIEALQIPVRTGKK